MSDMTLEKLLNTPPFSQPIPASPILKAKAFIRELATGALYNYWTHQFIVTVDDDGAHWVAPSQTNLITYTDTKWLNHAMYPELLKVLGYVTDEGHNSAGHMYQLTQAAFHLIEEIPAIPVFISYRNQDSAAFALLLYARMKMVGLEPFLDLASLRGGDAWDEKLRHKISTCEYVICMLGQETLTSDYVRDEIQIAADNERLIIPVFHNGFRDKDLRVMKGNGDAIATILESRQGIVVREERGLDYNSAVIEILNALGIAH